MVAATVGEALGAAEARYGDPFTRVLRTSKVWVNGVEALPTTVLAEDDEVAVLPPVSGGVAG